MLRPVKLVHLLAAIAVSSSIFAPSPAQAGWFDRLEKSRQSKSKDAATATPVVEPSREALNLQNSFANVAAAVKPAVVNISAVQITRVQEQPQQFYFGDPNEFFYRFFGETPPGMAPRGAPRQREFRSEGTGSGVLIDPKGYVLTNNHVIQRAQQLTVTLSDGKTYKGRVVGTDSRTDLAVIQIKRAEPFPFAPLGDSSAMRIGDWVVAIGSPFGLEQTVTAGIVSAIRQSLTIEDRTFRNMIQTDAAINRGNSGGPLLNLRGEVIGINTAIFAPTGVFSGIGFAIPVNDVKQIMDDLIHKGFVERSWMGVEILPLNDVLAEQFGLSSSEGALVNRVLDGSPASKGGIRRGDVIVEFDGKKVASVQALQDMVAATQPERQVKVRVMRDGNPTTLTLRTEKLPPPEGEDDTSSRREGAEAPAAPQSFEWLGGTFRAASGGVTVVDLAPEGAAVDAGLQPGDIVRAVNRQPVSSLADLQRVAGRIDVAKGVVFDVVRGGRSLYLSYKPL